MTESQREQMLTYCKQMLRTFTDEELEIQAQALQTVRAEMENKRIAEGKLSRLLEFCDRHSLVLKNNTIIRKEMM